MARYSLWGLIVGGWLLACCPARAADDLQQELSDHIFGSHWIYNDINSAVTLARTQRKPLLVLFRCVPCDCAGTLDEALNEAGNPSEALQKKFVCVRIVHMKGVDLNRFQFDHDVSLVAIFMNPDGTVYGRYGTRASHDRRANTHISLASFTKAMERALALHAEYPLNKKELAGKQPQPGKYRRPEEMPYLAKEAEGTVTSKNCIHCHMVGEAYYSEAKQQQKLTHERLWRFPLPENLGTSLDVDDGLTVKKLRPDSPAAKADIRLGDAFVRMNGQPLVSQADIQWILDQQPQTAQVQVTLDRNGQQLEKTLSLSGNWRKTDNGWRPSLNPLRPDVELRNVSHGTYQGLGIPVDRLLMSVNYPRGAAAKAGLRNGDLVTAIDGQDHYMREGEWLEYLYLSGPPKKQVTLSVVRGKPGQTQALDVVLPIP